MDKHVPKNAKQQIMNEIYSFVNNGEEHVYKSIYIYKYKMIARLFPSMIPLSLFSCSSSLSFICTSCIQTVTVYINEFHIVSLCIFSLLYEKKPHTHIIDLCMFIY